MDSADRNSRGSATLGKGRLEAFSDGVIAIIITIMVLELKVPHGVELENLRDLLPVFFCYVLSFVYVGIYWNNHHHLLHTARRVSGSILWANLFLLFWLSLVPFTTSAPPFPRAVELPNCSTPSPLALPPTVVVPV